MSALYTGVSGLQTYGDAMQVVGDNIANINTTAYKSSRANFSELLGQSISGGSSYGQVGQGVTTSDVTTSFASGSFKTTDNVTDMAINGNGLFVVENAATGATYYTRDGSFSFNSSGQLVTDEGYVVMGYDYDATGATLSSTLSALAVDTASTAPSATQNIDLTLNLDSSTAINSSTFNVLDPSGTSDYSTSASVYDANGNSHDIGVYFTKTADNTWNWNAVVDGGDVTGGTAGTDVLGGSGTLTFDASGNLTTAVTGTAPSFNFLGTAQTINFNVGDSSTQYADSNSVSSESQDGYASGTLSSISVGTDGTISGVYSNGKTLALGKVAVATFANYEGLGNNGSGLYSATTDSGVATVNTAGNGSAGSISDYSLEESNVDLSTEFVNLIAYQNGYEANSKIITTGNSMLTTLINMIQ
jgi:flagellar hook protein FlgE